MIKTWVLEPGYLGSNLSPTSHQLCDVGKSPNVSVHLGFFIYDVAIIVAPTT